MKIGNRLAAPEAAAGFESATICKHGEILLMPLELCEISSGFEAH